MRSFFKKLWERTKEICCSHFHSIYVGMTLSVLSLLTFSEFFTTLVTGILCPLFIALMIFLFLFITQKLQEVKTNRFVTNNVIGVAFGNAWVMMFFFFG